MSPGSAAAITVVGLEKAYKRTQALAGLSFEMPTGAITGFLGPNGAGKTTTFRALLGLTRFDAGDVQVLGHSVPGELLAVTKKVGAIVEEPGLIKALNGRVNLRVAADQLGFGHEKIDEMLEFVGLTVDAKRKVSEYSKGMRQRLALAAALIGNPELLLLDEPLDGLDPSGQRVFRARLRAIADAGQTVVVSSHDMSDIEALADYVVVIDHGQLVTQGPIEQLLDGGGTRVRVADPERAIEALNASRIEASYSDGFVVALSDDGASIVEILAANQIYPSEVTPERASLESFFLGMTSGGDIGAEDVR
jgi:ABC-2 type transport system ATP-binding protein